MNFNIGEEELAKMGFVDMDILKRSGYTAAVNPWMPKSGGPCPTPR